MAWSGGPAASSAINWPKSGFLFPVEAGCRDPPLDPPDRWLGHQEGEGFVKENRHRFPDLLKKAPRSHSGRRHCVTWMVSEGVAPSLAMALAQIKHPRVFKGYTDLTPEMVFNSLRPIDARCPAGALRART